MLSSTGTEAESPKLRERDDSMLTSRQLGHRPLQRQWVEFATVDVVDSTHPAMVAGSVLQRYAGVLRNAASPSKMRPTPGRSPGVSATKLQRTTPSGPTITSARLVMPPGSK